MTLSKGEDLNSRHCANAGSARILVLAPDIYTRGGIARYTWTLASTLGELVGSDNVHVLPLLDGGGPKEAPKKFHAIEPAAGPLTPTAKLRFAGKALGQARNGYELVVCTHVALAGIAAVIRALCGTPYWVVCHGIETWRRLPILDRMALRRADLALPVSQFTAERVAEVNGVSRGKVRVLYNAVPDEFAALLTSQSGASVSSLAGGRPKRLLSVGMLTKTLAYKGFDTVIKALPRVLETVPDLRYVVAGEGDNKENLAKQAVDLGVAAHVEFTGQVSDAELAALYQTCDVFVLPSRVHQVNGRWEGEGFGRVYVEAALAGKPVVGSRDGGAAEAVLDGRTGLLVDPESIEDVVAALITLLRDPGLAARMGCDGQSWAREKFTTRPLREELQGMLSTLGKTRREGYVHVRDLWNRRETIEQR